MKRQIMKAMALLLILLLLPACGTTPSAGLNQAPEAADTGEIQEETEEAEQPEESEDSQTSQTQTESDSEEETEQEEYLFITTTAYTNGQNREDGVNLVLYCYHIAEQRMEVILDTPIHSTFPANYIDIANQKIYYAAANEGENYDNLFVYDLATGQSEQLTDGKYLFNDILLLNGTLYVNTARQYATVTQPAMFDWETRTFQYLNAEDDDTWHYSFSYNYSTEQLLILTCSDSEMRTHRVAAETHIRPKTISFLDMTLETKTPVFFTEDYEIRLTRQLDENHILMTVDPFMGSGAPRTLKLLTIDTQEVTDYEIPDIDAVNQFNPRDNGEGLFLVGKDFDTDNEWHLYYYDIPNQAVSRVVQDEEIPDGFATLTDIVYSIQSVSHKNAENSSTVEKK